MKKRPANWKHPISKDTVLTHTSVPHDPIDDYELPAHIDVDYTKVKPNRFANIPHRGDPVPMAAAKRTKRRTEPTERHRVTLYSRQIKMLRKIDPNLSRAIRIVLDTQSMRETAAK